MVLERPEIPLHTNGSENDIRCQVSRRKVSAGTHSYAGPDCRDVFLGLAKTCAKYGVAFWDYLGPLFQRIVTERTALAITSLARGPGREGLVGFGRRRSPRQSPRVSRVKLSPTKRWSARTLTGQYNAHGGHQGDQVEHDRAMLHIVQIVRQLFADVLDRGAIGEVDLRPTGQARLDVSALAVERDGAR
jgi:hypothetical protein